MVESGEDGERGPEHSSRRTVRSTNRENDEGNSC